jgi:hypothetical protein
VACRHPLLLSVVLLLLLLLVVVVTGTSCLADPLLHGPLSHCHRRRVVGEQRQWAQRWPGWWLGNWRMGWRAAGVQLPDPPAAVMWRRTYTNHG